MTHIIVGRSHDDALFYQRQHRPVLDAAVLISRPSELLGREITEVIYTTRANQNPHIRAIRKMVTAALAQQRPMPDLPADHPLAICPTCHRRQNDPIRKRCPECR